MDDSRQVLEPSRRSDSRSAFRVDRDRILYSTQFSRLAEITQVVSPERGYVFHNRLTHSMKVAQIARTIAEIFATTHRAECDAWGGVDPDAAEAAGLAHDLGHPPFGHIAEEEIDRLVRDAGVQDGFEGNAQSFRIVSQLSVGDGWTMDGGEATPVRGLNLTRSTLAGIIKYPWAHGGNLEEPRKWGFYAGEREHFEWARAGVGGHQRSLIAEIMDWADDVTYAIHDLLDFYRAGLIPLELVRTSSSEPGSVERRDFLARMFERRRDWAGRATAYESALDDALERLPFDAFHRYAASTHEEQLLYQYATDLISRFVNAIKPAEAGAAAPVVIEQEARDQVDVLKEFVWGYVILDPDMALLQAGQRKAIEAVFEASLRAAQRQTSHFFPGGFRQRLAACTTDEDRVRLAADYVSRMTERELLRTHRILQGVSDR